MAVGSHLSPDFVGYETGIPTTASVGFVGLLDFAGYPVGVGEEIPPFPPVEPNHKGGGLIINVHHHVDPLKRKRRREDEEILILRSKRV